MSVEIAWKQNILVTDSYLLKLLLVVLGFGLQAFVCDFSRQNICSASIAKLPGFIVIDLSKIQHEKKMSSALKSVEKRENIAE